jgi:hypothetical protein
MEWGNPVKPLMAFDEAGVKRTLAMGPKVGQGNHPGIERIKQCLLVIHQHLRNDVCAVIKNHFPSLRPEDIADNWQDTLSGVFDSAIKGHFDEGPPLFT